MSQLASSPLSILVFNPEPASWILSDSNGRPDANNVLYASVSRICPFGILE